MFRKLKTLKRRNCRGGGAPEALNSSHTNENGDTVTEFRDNDNTLSRDIVKTQTGDTTETIYASDGKTPVQTTETTSQGQVTQVNYNDDGTPQSKQVKLGSTTSNYTYDTEGNEVLNSKVENEGIDAKEKRTEYTHNEDGTVTEKATDHNSTAVTTRNADGKGLSQTKTVNGQEYTVEYDGEGNTKGVIVQNGESPTSIAKKFGVSVEDLTSVNQDVLNGKKYFNVGDEIKIPREVEADDPALQGRKSAEETQADYAQDAQIRQQQHELRVQQRQAQRQAELKSLGVVSTRNAGQKRVGYFGQENLGNRTKSPHTYTVVGQTANREREIVVDEKGTPYTMAHDGTILNENYVRTTNLYDSGPKVKGQVKGKNGQMVTKNYVVVGNLTHGRKSVVDEKGQTHVMSADGKILDSSYLARSDQADVIRSDKNAAKTATLDFLDGQLENAQKAYNAQRDKDGWAADVADGVSNIWGWAQEDGNQGWRVRRDMQEYKSTLNTLRQAAKRGDTKTFNTTFYNYFGVEYNENAVANYTLHPTEANYRNAFGTKHDIGARVAKYNSSQDTGAEVVKTTAKVGAGIAIGVATGGSGLVALGTAAVATGAVSAAIEETDRLKVTDVVTKGEINFREGTDHKKILVNAAFDGATVFAGGVAGKAIKGAAVVGSTATRTAGQKVLLTSVNVSDKAANVINTTGKVVASTVSDVAIGAGRELAQDGHITVEGTLTNAAISATGQAIGSGAAASIGRKTRNAVTSGYQRVKSRFTSGKPSSDVHLNQNATPALNTQPKVVSAPESHTAIKHPAGESTTSTVTQKAGGQTNPAGSSSGKFNLNQPFDDALSSVGNIKSQAELNEAFGALQSNSTLSAGQKQAMSRALVNRRKALTAPSETTTQNASNHKGVQRMDAELNPGQRCEIADNAKIQLGHSCVLDFRQPQIRSKIEQMKPGDRLTVGRDANADIVVGDKHMDVSRQHAIIGKDKNGQLYIQDTSANGTKIASGFLRALSSLKGKFLTQEAKKLTGNEIKQEAKAMQEDDDENNVHQA